MSVKIIQFFGWKNDDMFDVLISLSTGEIKNSIADLHTKFQTAINDPHCYICYNMTGQDIHDRYNAESDKKKKTNLVKAVEDDLSMASILSNLWDFVKLINEEKKLSLKLSVFHGLYMYNTYFVSFNQDSSYESHEEIQFPTKLIVNTELNPKATFITIIITTAPEEKRSYPNSCDTSPRCSRCDHVDSSY